MQSLLRTSALLAALLFTSTALADVRLDVRAEPRSVSIDDTVTLRVSVESRGASAADVKMPALDGFDVVSQSVQRPMQFSFSFGSGAVVQSSIIYTYVLRPQRVGAIVIRPISAELDGERRASAPITITVSTGARDNAPAQPAPDAAAQNGASTRGSSVDLAEVDGQAFVRVVADKPDPFVGEQVTVSMYLYVRERLQTQPAVELEPTTDGFWVHDLLAGNQQVRAERQIVGGTIYSVYPLRRYAAFPLHEGELTIGPIAMRIDTSSMLDVFGRRRGDPILQRRSQPLVLNARALPEQGKPAGEIAVGRYELSAKLDRTQSATGDAVMLTVTVRGQGNVRTIQLPKPSVDGLDVLDPEVKDLIETPGDVLTGTREYRFLIVPQRPGRFALPPFSLPTFEPEAERYVTLTTPPLELEVVGRALDVAPTPTPSPAQDATQPPADAPPPAPATPAYEWAPARTHSALTRKRAPFAGSTGFWLGLTLPPLVLLGWLAVGATRRRARARGETSAGRAEREANDKLRAAEDAASRGDARSFYAASATALLAALEARLGEPATGLTLAQLERHLTARGMDAALAREVVRALERWELQRFGGGGSEGELASDLGALKSLRARLDAWKPRAKEAA